MIKFLIAAALGAAARHYAPWLLLKFREFLGRYF
jgi:hypothetical protein